MIPSDAELNQLAQVANLLVTEAAQQNRAPQNMALPPSYVLAMVAELRVTRAATAQAVAQRGNSSGSA